MSQPDKAVVRPRQKLTERQREILDLIESKWTDDGPPSVRALCSAASIESTHCIHSHITALERKGWLVRRTGQPMSRSVATRSGILRLTAPRTWPWWNVTLHGLSAAYQTSIQAPTFSLAGVWAREDWHAIGAPDTLEGIEIFLSPRTEPEFEGWQEVAHAE